MLSPYHLTNFLEAGTDEAGRGCLAGPVTCAAIILSENIDDRKHLNNDQINFLHEQINDSKKLSHASRVKLKPDIENFALSFAVIHIPAQKIDQINILQASILGMQTAVLNLTYTPKHLIVDGNYFNAGTFLSNENKNLFYEKKVATIYKGINGTNFENLIPYTTIIKGDEKFLSIAAASILSKTHRDEYMTAIHNEFPMYNWAQNKGYPTKEHKNAILKYGLTKYHRLSFRSTL